MPTVGDVLKVLTIEGGSVAEDHQLDWVSSLSDPKDWTLSFLNAWDESAIATVASHPCTVFLAPVEVPGWATPPINCILVENPRLAYALAANSLFGTRAPARISPTAIVEPGAELGEGASVGNNVVVEDGARIGARVTIGHNTVIHSGVEIGNDVIVGSNTVIGSIGFGIERDGSGVPHRIPHLGGVSIGDRVEIGSCCTIARGTIKSTVLETDVKVDDGVFVGHNSHVREGAFLTAAAITCGSADIGRRAWIAPGSIVINKAAVGDDVMLGLGAVVVGDVASESLAVGVPARVRGKNPMLPPGGYAD